MASGVSSSVVGTVGAVSDGVDAVAYGVSGGEIWFFGGKNTSFKTKHNLGIKAVGNGVSGGIKAVGKGWYNLSFQMIISGTNVPPFSFSRRIEFLIENRISAFQGSAEVYELSTMASWGPLMGWSMGWLGGSAGESSSSTLIYIQTGEDCYSYLV